MDNMEQQQQQPTVIPSLQLTAGQQPTKQEATTDYRKALRQLDANAQLKQGESTAATRSQPQRGRVKVYQHNLFSPPTNDPESDTERYEAQNRDTGHQQASQSGGRVVRSMKHSPVQFEYPMYFGENADDTSDLRDTTPPGPSRSGHEEGEMEDDDKAVELVGSPFVEAQSFLSESSQLSYSYSDSGTGESTPEKEQPGRQGTELSEASPTNEASRRSPEFNKTDKYFSPKEYRFQLQASSTAGSWMSSTAKELSNPSAARCLSLGQPGNAVGQAPYSQESQEPEEVDVLEEPDLSDSWKRHTGGHMQQAESHYSTDKFGGNTMRGYSEDSGNRPYSDQSLDLEEPSEEILEIDLKTTKLLSEDLPDEEESSADLLITDERTSSRSNENDALTTQAKHPPAPRNPTCNEAMDRCTQAHDTSYVSSTMEISQRSERRLFNNDFTGNATTEKERGPDMLEKHIRRNCMKNSASLDEEDYTGFGDGEENWSGDLKRREIYELLYPNMYEERKQRSSARRSTSHSISKGAKPKRSAARRVPVPSAQQANTHSSRAFNLEFITGNFRSGRSKSQNSRGRSKRRKAKAKKKVNSNRRAVSGSNRRRRKKVSKGKQRREKKATKTQEQSVQEEVPFSEVELNAEQLMQMDSGEMYNEITQNLGGLSLSDDNFLPNSDSAEPSRDASHLSETEQHSGAASTQSCHATSEGTPMITTVEAHDCRVTSDTTQMTDSTKASSLVGASNSLSSAPARPPCPVSTTSTTNSSNPIPAPVRLQPLPVDPPNGDDEKETVTYSVVKRKQPESRWAVNGGRVDSRTNRRMRSRKADPVARYQRYEKQRNAFTAFRRAQSRPTSVGRNGRPLFEQRI